MAMNYKPTTISADGINTSIVLEDRDYMIYQMLQEILNALERLRLGK